MAREVPGLREPNFFCRRAVGDDRMHLGVEAGGVRAERLDREDETRRDVVAIEDRADARNREGHASATGGGEVGRGFDSRRSANDFGRNSALR